MGILYVNESRKQLVLAHKSIEADWKSFFSSVGGLNNTLDGIVQNKIVPQLYACYEMTRKANKIAQELNLDEQTVRNYFGAHQYKDGEVVEFHLEPGPNGGIVHLEDTTILDRAKQIISESKNNN